MKITILTYGSQGDVEPFISLAKGLINAGYSVRLAAPEFFEFLIDCPEIEFLGLPGDPQGLVRDLVEDAGKSRWRMVSAMSKFVLPLAAEVSELIWTTCKDSDLVIHSFLLTSTGHQLAREIGIPDISAQLFPVFSRTAEFPAPTFPDLPLGGLYRQLTHDLVTQTFWRGSQLLYGRVKKNYPDLPPLTGCPFDARDQRLTPILYAISSLVIPKPKDWPDEAHLTGYWSSNEYGEWTPGKELLDFINESPKPIAIAFGSTVTRNLGEIYEKVLEALSRSNQRGIFVGNKYNLRVSSQTIFQTDYVPYSWLFKRSAAIIHHGGAGTTGKGLMAGVPNIILPFTSDQPFWGNRVYKLGAGPKPIPAKKLSVNRLTKAIAGAIYDAGMRERASQIGEGIRKEDGVSQAVNIIQKCVEKQTR